MTGQADMEEALAHHQAGRLPEAERIYKRVLAGEPGHAGALHLLGVAAHQCGEHERAITLISRAVDAVPVNAFFLNNLGEAHRALEQWAQAADCYQRCLSIDARHAAAHNNLALVHVAENRLEDAAASFRSALALTPDDPEVHANLGDVFTKRGKLADAIACYQRAVALEPGLASVHGRLGRLALEQRRPAEAADCFTKALVLQPGDADTHVGLARALVEQHRFEEAEAAARAALRLSPEQDSASELLGHALFHQGRHNEASEAFLTPIRRFRALGSHLDNKNLTFTQVSRAKLQQDIEQLQYLIECGRLPGEHHHLLKAYEDFAARHADNAERTVMLQVPPEDAIAPYYNRLIVDAPEPAIPGGSLNPDLDTKAIESAFYGSQRGFTQFDQLLNDAALLALRRYCLEPSIWFQWHYNNEVSTTLYSGFCCPLLLQIAADIRAVFPRVFGDHLFVTCWAYKYFQGESGGFVHADSGATSLNLWITPDESNLETDTGGLVLWNKSVPDNYFSITQKEQDHTSQVLLAEPDAESGYVAYACNRAMLFQSNLLHKTQRSNFKDAYPHRRVNVTFLYGKPGQ